MKIAIPKEIRAHERRVSATPKTVKKMVKAGMTVSIETGAGIASSISDQEYSDAGAQIEQSVETLWGQADVVLKVQGPVLNESTGRYDRATADQSTVGSTF